MGDWLALFQRCSPEVEADICRRAEELLTPRELFTAAGEKTEWESACFRFVFVFLVGNFTDCFTTEEHKFKL